MDDEELMWMASVVPRIVNYAFNRTSKVAFLFLTKGRLPLASLCESEMFFRGHEGYFSIYSSTSMIHTLPDFTFEPSESSVFYKRRIPSKMTAAAAAGDRRGLKEIIYDGSAGAAAGAIAATFVCPLDVIKTRLQIHGLPKMQPSGRQDLQTIVRNEGLRGLYRGLTPTIAALLPNWAVYFTVYGHLKELLHSYEGSKGQLTIASNMIAAAGAGAATSIATNPLWAVKTRLQTQGMRQDVVPYKNIFSALTRIAHEEGFRGWYSGLLPSLAGISHVAIQFPAYERIKFYLAKRENKSYNELNSWEVSVASSFAKVVASVLTYPHEVFGCPFHSTNYAYRCHVYENYSLCPGGNFTC
ncbi:Nicotinamide adenine dinucleotide transporter 2, mitochondrial [Orobanche gracilis]